MGDRDRARACLAPFLARHPALSIDLVAEARKLNLFRREADIALRPSKFQQLEIFQRAIAVIQFGLYASDDYLARMGPPDFATKGQGHALVAAGAGMGATIVDSEWLPPLLGRARVAARTNGRLGMAALAAAGIGIACLPRSLGDATPGLRRLPTPKPGPHRQLWMGVHRSARAVPRMRAVGDHLIDAFGRLSRRRSTRVVDCGHLLRGPASSTSRSKTSASTSHSARR